MLRLLMPLALAALLALCGCSKPNPILSPALPPPKPVDPTANLKPEYRAAIADLEKQGGKVEVMGEESDEPRLVIAFPNMQATDSHLELVKRLKVSSLDLKNSKVTDRGLQDLQEMTTLTILMLDGTPVTNQGLGHLDKLTDLRVLTLGEQHITDAGLEHLKGMTQLFNFQVTSDRITDRGLAALSGFKNLRALLIGSPQITDAGLEQLKGLTGLKLLGIRSPQITDQGLVALNSLNQLNELILSGCSQITDAGLKRMEGLAGLQSLHLRDCPKISDTGLEIQKTERFCGRFNALRKPGGFEMDSSQLRMDLGVFRVLDVRGTSVTAAGINKLQKAMPTLRIDR